MFPPIDHFTDHDATVDQGKVLGHASGRDRDEEATGRLGVDEEGAPEVGGRTPVDQRSEVGVISLGSTGANALLQRAPRAGKKWHRMHEQLQRDMTGEGDVRRVTK